jgi:cell division protein FtsZ
VFEFENENVNSTVIKVVGVGGGGSNAVSRMAQSQLQGVEFIVINTDAQALQNCNIPCKIQIGQKITRGLGAGSNPEIGQRAANEDKQIIEEYLENSDMVFITAGMGGGTGTGAAPVIAKIAKDLGALTVAVVTKPFAFEGKRRKDQADYGLEELIQNVDTLITIPNQKLLSVADVNTTFQDAFKLADNVLYQAIQGVANLITVPGIINLDFADVKTIMANQGNALMGIGVGKGENKAVDAAQQAISSPLLENVSIDGAKGILISITGGSDMLISEVDEAATIITEKADKDSHIIFGAVIDENMVDEMRITVIATGFKQEKKSIEKPAGNMVDLESFKSDRPAFKRRLNNPQPILNQNESLEVYDEIYEIPTFMRKQAD